MPQSRGRPCGGRASYWGGPRLGELSGGTWMTEWAAPLLTGAGAAGRSGGSLRCLSQPGVNFLPFPRGGQVAAFGDVLVEEASRASGVQDSYLVDSASSHMLVSKIKPCMSKYKQIIL